MEWSPSLLIGIIILRGKPEPVTDQPAYRAQRYRPGSVAGSHIITTLGGWTGLGTRQPGTLFDIMEYPGIIGRSIALIIPGKGRREVYYLCQMSLDTLPLCTGISSWGDLYTLNPPRT